MLTGKVVGGKPTDTPTRTGQVAREKAKVQEEGTGRQSEKYES